MPDALDTLGSLVDEIKATPGIESLGVSLTDARGYMQAAGSWTYSSQAAIPLRLPSETQLDALLAELYPEPADDGAIADGVFAMFLQLGVGPWDQLASLTALATLSWPSIWSVVRRLASQSPAGTMDSYVTLAVQSLHGHAEENPKAAAALTVAYLAHGSRNVGAGDLSIWESLTALLLRLDNDSQIEVLAFLGMTPDQAEGVVAEIIAIALDEGIDLDLDLDLLDDVSPLPGLRADPGMPAVRAPPDWLKKLNEVWKGINRDRTDFKDVRWNRRQPWLAYSGTAIHLEIAEFYRRQHMHGLLRGGIWTNVTPVSSILNGLAILFASSAAGEKFKGFTRAMAASRPDIFELVFAHAPLMPPGWVYEIKPWGRGKGAKRAEREAAFYAAALTLCSIPAAPGPPEQPGTFGVVPVPGGWVAFTSPLPGVIVYRKARASKRALQHRNQDPASKNLIDFLMGLGFTLATAAMIAALLAAIASGGWVVALA